MIIDKVLEKIKDGVIKTHSKCSGVDITNLQTQAVSTEVNGLVVLVRCNSHEDNFKLAIHHKSGKPFIPWIGLAQCLVRLSKKTTEGEILFLRKELVFQTARADILEDLYVYSEEEFFNPDIQIRELQWKRIRKSAVYGMKLFGLEGQNVALVSSEDANKAYRRLANKYHPDKGGLTEDMLAINEMKRVLDLANEVTRLTS